MTGTSVSYRFHLSLLATLALIFLWSAIEPAGRGAPGRGP